jgi:hypothetical protein
MARDCLIRFETRRRQLSSEIVNKGRLRGIRSYVAAFMNEQTLAFAFLVRLASLPSCGSTGHSSQTWTSAERFQEQIHLDVIYFKSQQKIENT